MGDCVGDSGVLLAGWLLDRLNHVPGGSNPLVVMKWCAILFMCSAVFGFFDIHLFRWVPDHTQPAPKRVTLSHIFAGPMRDRPFLWFAGFVGTLTFAISFMGQFVTLYMLEKLHSTSTQVQFMLLVAPMIAQLLVLPIWGKAADRMGKKPVLAIASLGLVPVGFGLVFLLAGSLVAGIFIVGAGGGAVGGC